MVRRAGYLLVLGVALSGCGGGDESGMEGDCMAALVWDGLRYERAQVKEPPDLGPPLADGVFPACAPEPEREIAVRALRGIHPSIAVATPGTARDQPGGDAVWLGPGYVRSSPLHPLHDQLRPLPHKHTEDEWDCKQSRTVRVRLRERPAAFDDSIRVTADDETEAFIRGDDLYTYISLDQNTVVEAPRRHGVPYLAAGAELIVATRECVGEADEPGLRGLRLVVATRVRAADP